MIRAHENSLALRAGALSVLVHVVLLVILLVSFNWKTVQAPSIAQVELWDSLPAPALEIKPEPPKPEPVVKPEPPKPEPVIEPEPEPPKPEPQPEPKAEIQVKKEPIKEPVKPKPKEKPKEEKPKVDPKKKEKELEKERAEAIKKLQQEMLAAEESRLENRAAQDAASKAAQAASSGEVNEYKNRIANKIKGYVNPQLCGTDKVELRFKIAVMPTGELAGAPQLAKSSGIPACDQAVERAILQAEPLPLPEQPELRAQFRNIELPFYPNER